MAMLKTAKLKCSGIFQFQNRENKKQQKFSVLQ